MARNEEKAMSMLNRFRKAMANESGDAIPRSRKRPTYIKSVADLKEAEHWRHQVFQEISKKVVQIQNPSLSEYQIKELNDEINLLIKEKGRWEYRIKELGGKNYMQASKLVDNQGRELSNLRTWKYFGRAKELAESKDPELELSVSKLDQDEIEEKYTLNAQYYGFKSPFHMDKVKHIPMELSPLENALFYPISIPTREEIEQVLLERKKQELLKRFASFPS
jgi:pre-mRNA-splicing factor ISY1